MKNIAFTICSNNYLAQAKVLSDSVFKFSRDFYDFYIVLCDEYSEKIDYSKFHANFVLAKDLKINNFDWMTHYYNIIELNTAIKPFAFKYLIAEHSPEYIHYLDPDTCTYSSLEIIEGELGKGSILLTPHSLAPLPFDGKIPTDNIFLNHGIYNLGFLGLRVSDGSLSMLDWWGDFLKTHCLDRVDKGFFVDQLPMELVPLYFNDITVICFHRGINMAYWNLHDRQLKYEGGSYIVNDIFPLVLFHFSNYKATNSSIISRYYNRMSIEENPAIRKIYMDYASELNSLCSWGFSSVECVYTKTRDGFLRNMVLAFLSKIASLANMIYQKANRI